MVIVLPVVMVGIQKCRTFLPKLFLRFWAAIMDLLTALKY